MYKVPTTGHTGSGLLTGIAIYTNHIALQMVLSETSQEIGNPVCRNDCAIIATS